LPLRAAALVYEVAVPDRKYSDCSYPTCESGKSVEPSKEIPLGGAMGP
jgi:hypothetical protein